MNKKEILIPNYLRGRICNYKVIKQSLNIEYCEEYMVANQIITIKIPRFKITNDVLHDIYDMCDIMSIDNKKASCIGFGDYKSKTYRINISTFIKIKD